MYENASNERLRSGVGTAQATESFLASPAGTELRRIMLEIANKWLGEVRKGNSSAYVALNVLDEIAASFDMTISLGEAMMAELVRRQGGSSEHANTTDQLVAARLAL